MSENGDHNQLKDQDKRLVRMGNATVDPKMFERFPVGKEIDYFFSDEGGVMRGTVIMVIGDPGVGKTTITSDTLADIQITYPEANILFISSEEGFIDRAYSNRKSPKTGQTLTLFLGEEKEKKTTLEDILNQGWDIILIDSFKDTQDKIQAESDMNQAEAETWLLELMVNCSHGKNARNIYTTFICIQQVTKGKEFTGSNSLKHNTTAMMEMRFSKEYKGQRYVEFTKNRRCGAMVGEKLYYWFDEQTKQLIYSRMPKGESPQHTEELGTPVLLSIEATKKWKYEDYLRYVPEHLSVSQDKRKEARWVEKVKEKIKRGLPVVVHRK